MTALHEAALAYARDGIRVFPCIVDGKAPATPRSFEDATTDLDQINKWWQEADYNLAICPEHAGWAVIDVDHLDALGKLPEPLPETYEVSTPRGGRHFYFEGSIRASVRKLVPGEGIDTRGVRSYVLVSPSRVNGLPYTILNDRPIASLPEWVSGALERNAVEAQAPPAEIDERGAVSRARLLLRDCVRQGRLAVIGSGGDDLTLQLAYQLRDLGLSQEKSRELLIEEWYPHCDPNTIPEFIDEKCRNAWAYALNSSAGTDAVSSSEEVFGARIASLEIQDEPAKRSKFYPEDEDEQDATEEPKWLIPGVIPDQSSVLLYGPTGSYKSTLALDIGLSVASKVEILGSMPVRHGPVFYATLEGRASLKKRRRPAWRLLHQADGKIPFYVMRAPHIAAEGEMQEFGDEIHRKCKEIGGEPVLIILDTISKCMVGLNENDAKDAGSFISFVDALVDDFRCPVIAIGHTGKDVDRGHRGSEAFKANMDTRILVTVDKPSKIMTMKVEAHKDEDEREEPWYLKAKVLGRALVLEDISSAERQALLRGNDPYEPHKIGQALMQLGADRDDTAVPTHLLAVKLTMLLETDTPEQASEHIAKTEAALRKLSKGRLAAYVIGTGRDLKWRL